MKKKRKVSFKKVLQEETERKEKKEEKREPEKIEVEKKVEVKREEAESRKAEIKPQEKKIIEEPAKKGRPEIFEVVIFPLSSELYAVPVDVVEEIVNFRELIFVPNLPSYVAGLMELRNFIIPIIDLMEKFGFERKVKREESSILIINIKGNPIGFLVERISSIEKFRSDEILELPPVFSEDEKRYLEGLLRKEEKLIVLLNPDGLLTREELASLQELKKERI